MTSRDSFDLENERLLEEEIPANENVQTPLPKVQIGITLALQICEPITSMSIYPYINELVSSLDVTGGDQKKVGYYAGLIESLFFATEALTVLQWSRASDHFGRKPILLIGMGGTILSILCFGFSRTYWALVFSRCLTGLLNGNIGVMKSTIGDLTDPSNRAEAFAFIPACWALGGTIGPLLGGSLSRPYDRFPSFFKSAFWTTYPYALPCIATAGIVFAMFMITVAFFKEPLDSRIDKAPDRPDASSIELSPVNDEHKEPASSLKLSEKPVPLRQLLTPRVLTSVANYVSLAILDIAFSALFPLFCAMPISIGGLSLSPSTIGYILAIYGCANGAWNYFFFVRLVRRFGEGRVFVISMVMFIPLFAGFPVINWVARQQGGVSVVVWLLLLVFLCLAVIMGSGFGAVFLFVTASAPNKRSLGATNGLSQTSVSIARACGPAAATSLFSLSVERNYLGGYAVYAIFVGLTFAALFLAIQLPKKAWDEYDE